MIIIGIDPGIGGALSVIEDGLPAEVFDLPTTRKGRKTVIDEFLFMGMIASVNPDLAVIEQVGASPRMGVSGAFNFGYTAGILTGACAGYEIRVEKITPQKWKGVFRFLKRDKDDVRIQAIQDFPHLEEALKRKKDCDRADAIYIALAWEKLNDVRNSRTKGI